MNDGAGPIIVIFLVVLFIIWVLTGGPKNPNVDQPFEKPYTEQIDGAYSQ